MYKFLGDLCAGINTWRKIDFKTVRVAEKMDAKFTDAKQVFLGKDLDEFLGLPLDRVVEWLRKYSPQYPTYSNYTLLLVNRWVEENGSSHTEADLGHLKASFPYINLSDVFLEQVTPRMKWAALTKRELCFVRGLTRLAFGNGPCMDSNAWEPEPTPNGDFTHYSNLWYCTPYGYRSTWNNKYHIVTFPPDNKEITFLLDGFTIKASYNDEDLSVRGKFWVDITSTDRFVPEFLLISSRELDETFYMFDGELHFGFDEDDEQKSYYTQGLCIPC